MSYDVLELFKGDKIYVDGNTVEIGEILFQDVVINEENNKRSSADVEFRDIYGNYRHWQSWSDGGKILTTDGGVYEFEREIKTTATNYLYGMRLRGFSIGCQPMEGLIRREDDPGTGDRKYHDLLLYNRQLTDKEIEDYELDFLGYRFVEMED